MPTVKYENLLPEQLSYCEWLVTNGLGGFACGTIGGTPMRKYHGLLIASLSAPLGRMMMLNYAQDSVIIGNKEINLANLQCKNHSNHDNYIEEFWLERGLPVWRYKIGEIVLEKTIWMPHFQNTVFVSYHLVKAEQPIEIKWQPFFHFRNIEDAVNTTADKNNYHIDSSDNHYEIYADDLPHIRLYNEQHFPFTMEKTVVPDVYYEIEEKRGYQSVGPLTSLGYFKGKLGEGQRASFVASIEPWKVMLTMSAHEAIVAEKQRKAILLRQAKSLRKTTTGARLVVGADQFIITPLTRETDVIRLQAIGETVRSIIAGYPWFTDWGRDTMISLEGLTLTTGRFDVAHSILRTFAYYIKDGLIPNMFPDKEKQGLYHTADATLWFFHAVHRYIYYTGDVEILDFLLPKFRHIIDHHIQGTHYGIKMDSDGLLVQGMEGYQLTWMDAKVGDWVVTPRRGKAVEINALWYNALKIMELWTTDYSHLAEKCYQSFNKRFWNEKEGYLFDVIDSAEGNDDALRPNQLFAISLDYPVLKKDNWKSVVDICKQELLTKFGMRTLSNKHKDFKAYYDGDLVSRDSAYHQGTVWPWLLGTFTDAWLKVYPEKTQEARQFFDGLEQHLDHACMGNIGEIFDASDPYHARGCFAQAWSVAEFLRIFSKLNVN